MGKRWIESERGGEQYTNVLVLQGNLNTTVAKAFKSAALMQSCASASASAGLRDFI